MDFFLEGTRNHLKIHDSWVYYGLDRVVLRAFHWPVPHSIHEGLFPLNYPKLATSKNPHCNVCLIKNRSKLSSVLLLCLLRIFMRQTLIKAKPVSNLIFWIMIAYLESYKFKLFYFICRWSGSYF